MLVAGQASAQAMFPPCDGQYVTVRVSKLKPGGTTAGFMKAVADQEAWYRSKGITKNSQLAGKVFTTTGGKGAYQDGALLTIHMNAPDSGLTPPSDAAYAAFVKEFRDNSDIVSETRACLAK
jgi:hypothetical protein